MSVDHPASADDPAVIYFCRYLVAPEPPVDERQLIKDCRDFAHRRGFAVAEVVVDVLADAYRRPLGPDRISELLQQQPPPVVIIPALTHFPRRARPWGPVLRAWLRQGALIYVCDGGRLTEEELADAIAAIRSRPYPRRTRIRPNVAPGPASRPGSDATDWGKPESEPFRVDEDLWANTLSGTLSDQRAIAEPARQGTAGSMVRPGLGIPLRVRGEPLPHDGLFIRRNNSFGTRSTLGIADLIEQGVLIDQAQIRFDDFVRTETGQIPSPAGGEAIAVSHGTAAVDATLTAHDTTTHFLEVALRAAPASSEGVQLRADMPVNFVFVVDTSGSMSGEKLDQVKTGIQELYDRLRDIDVLGIVTFDTQVRTVLRATRKAALPPDRLATVVAGLSAAGGTDINMGILYGIDELGRHGTGRSDVVNCLYLFSDGAPTSGETNWIRIRANIAARIRGDVTLSCFGFGSDARMRELDALAGLTGGHSTFVTIPADIGDSLLEDLGRRDHLAAINLQLQIKIDPRITIWHLYGHDLITDPATRAAVEREAQATARRADEEYGTQSLPDLITEADGIRIFAPDLAFGETYWVVLELEVPPDAEPTAVGTATIQYVDTLARASRQAHVNLSAPGSIPPETVLTHGIGLWTSEITFYALDDLHQDDREAAKTRLSNHIKVLQSAAKSLPAPQFHDDAITVRKFISLTENLNRPISWTDHAQPTVATFTMNKFAHVRGGFVRTRYDTF